MKKLPMLTVLALAACLMLGLTGCARDADDHRESDGTDPTHFYEQVREDFRIDAEVVPFPAGVPKVYEGIRYDFPREDIDAFLTASGDSLTEWGLFDDTEMGQRYTGDSANGGHIFTDLRLPNLYPATLSYSHPHADWWGNYHIYAGQNHYDTGAEFVFADRFMEPKDFAFATAREAEDAVRSTLSSFGFRDLILNRALYVDHAVMPEITEELKKPEWSELKPQPVKEEWTAEEDGYIFEFFLPVDGAPLFYGSVSKDTYNYNGASIVVWYQEAGIVWLEVRHPFFPGEVAEAPEKIISAAQALDIARTKLANILTYQDVVISKVSGEYIYVHNNGSFLLRPVWIVYADYSYALHPEYRNREFVILDAVTGKEI